MQFTRYIFDRAAILRAAHATARSRMANNRAWRTYRQAFADALRQEWQVVKQAAAQAEVDAEEAALPPLPAAVTARIAAIWLEASYEPHTFAGHARFQALHREADVIAAAARAAIFTQITGMHHVAH